MENMINDLKKIGIDLEQENPFSKEVPDSSIMYSYNDLVGENNGQDDEN